MTLHDRCLHSAHREVHRRWRGAWLTLAGSLLIAGGAVVYTAAILVLFSKRWVMSLVRG